MLPVQVARREVVAPDVVSLWIVLPGSDQAPAPYLPGQFVTLALPTPRETLYRSYSLCGDGDPSQPWELTVKRVEMGAVSTYFYNTVEPGTLLYSSLPRGTFTLPTEVHADLDIVMVAMGSGITPIMGMLRALARLPRAQRPRVTLHYASRNEDDIIFGDELLDMDPNQMWLVQRHYLSTYGKRMSVDAILASARGVARRAYWYLCGAEGFKRELQAHLNKIGVPERQVFSEVFATQSGRPAYRVEGRAGAGIGGTLRIAETGATLDVQPRETILVALERHGYRPEYSCRAGSCGACKLRVLEGQVDPVGEALASSERTAGYVLSCVAHPVGDVVLASGGRPPVGARRVAGAAGSPSRAGAVALTRIAAIAGVGALLLGSWNLTNHRPASWDMVTTTSQPPNATTTIDNTPDSQSTPASQDTPTAQGTPATQGTPTTHATPTPRPTPKPVATSTPSRSH
jgi:ferredoxin-NADP reductase